MQVADFDFVLPPELIAQYPSLERSSSRLLCLNKNTGEISHKKFQDLPEFLRPGDLLIFNDTKVIPARFFVHKPSGGKVEILLERTLGEKQFLAHARASKSLKTGANLYFNEEDVQTNPVLRQVCLEVISREGDLFIFELKIIDIDNVSGELQKSLDILSLCEKIGSMPLPPYIDRPVDNLDKERYQTVFAKDFGAVAAPTAGLHFDLAMLDKTKDLGVDTAFVTLHVGAGTFQPVRVFDITQHKMHKERIKVDEAVCAKVNATKKRGGRIIAVGTTVVRSLETAMQQARQSNFVELKPFIGETDIFIYPGYKMQCVDAILTNFHLPKSTLLMLISAFAGIDLIKKAYAEAILKRYRFFSYGDAMLIV